MDPFARLHPILEAMACGVPVACSNVSSLPEVAGDAAAYFDPHDEEAVMDNLKRLLTDPATQEQLVDSGRVRTGQFKWSNAAENTLLAIETAADSSL